jgi:hypothetical protein
MILTMTEVHTPRPQPHSQRSLGHAYAQQARETLETKLAAAEASQGHCGGCATVLLCGAAALEFTDLVSDSARLKRSSPAAELYGIAVTEDGTVCPGELVRAALHRTQTGDFWVAKDDPLHGAGLYLQAADAVLQAVQDVARTLNARVIR